MATNNEIPVRRRRGGGIPWWAWLIGLALLALLAFWLLNNLGGNSGNNNNSAGGAASGAVQSQAAGASGGTGTGAGAAGSGAGGGAAAGGPITAVADVSGATDAATVAGRPAEIADATVQEVTGDVTFWVGESAEDRVFVRMDEDASGGEQGIQVEEGQTLRITGQVEEVPADTAAWELTEEDASALGEQPVYIAASRVEVAE